MSKESAVALLVIETAKRSFDFYRIERLDKKIWDEVCQDNLVQKDVIRNFRAREDSIFRLRKNNPTANDFEDLRLEFRGMLDNFLRMPALRALFLCYQAEFELYDEITGAISDSVEEIVWEKLDEEIYKSGF